MAAGLLVGEICMGGLGRVGLRSGGGGWPTWLDVRSSQPVLACLGQGLRGRAPGWRPMRALQRAG